MIIKHSVERLIQGLEVCLRCKILSVGKQLHSKIIVQGLTDISSLRCRLITLYTHFGHLSLAEFIFSQSSEADVFLFNVLIRQYSVDGLYRKALDFFYQHINRVKPDSHTFSCILNVCSSVAGLHEGRGVHCVASKNGFGSYLFVSNAVIAMYAECDCILEASKMFDNMPERDVVSWNSIISSFVRSGFELEAFIGIQEMIRSGLKPDHVTLVSTVTIAPSVLATGEMHGFAIRNGFESDLKVCNSLISGYGQCGMIQDALTIFSDVSEPDRVTWNSVVSCCAQNGLLQYSFQLLDEMCLRGFQADLITYSGIISSCSQSGHCAESYRAFKLLLTFGLRPDVIAIVSILPAVSDLGRANYCKEIHSFCFRGGLESDRRIRNAFVSVYSQCGFIRHAVQIFMTITHRDIISWSSMVGAYVLNGNCIEAVELFGEMIRSKTEPNPIVITGVLSACAKICSLKQGKEIHLWALKQGLEGQTFVGSALIDMYAKCGRIKEARIVFDLLNEKNLVSWNAMIGAYAIHGLGKKAIEIFKMVEQPDGISFLAALSACTHEGLVDDGINIFNSMKQFKISPQEGHYSCIVDLLGKSGRLAEGLTLIKEMPTQASSNTWGVLLGACKIYSNLKIGMYAGTQIIKNGCENPGFYVLIANLLADSGKWEDVEAMRKTNDKGKKKETGLSRVEFFYRVSSLVNIPGM